MSFDVGADSYGRFMGRYSEPLAARFLAAVGVTAGQHVLDVGCGPGALTAALVERLGSELVAAVDPSESFVSAARARLPGVDVRQASAAELPYAAGSFDAVLAQLVVHFMSDPIAGLTEMARVTRPGGIVSACVWDHFGGLGPLSIFWRAVRELDPTAIDESGLPGAREGQLAEFFTQAGLQAVRQTALTVTVGYDRFEDWWQPFTLGVGPAGAYVAELGAEECVLLRTHCAELLPTAPFTVTATAWAAIGCP